MSGRLHAIESEETVLGAVLVHQKCFLDVSPVLMARDFYHPTNRAIYEAMIELDASSRPIDAITVTEQMWEMGTADKLHGEAPMVELMAKVVTFENLGYHAALITRKAERRRWVEATREMATSGMGDIGDEEYISECEAKLLSLGSLRKHSTVTDMKTALRTAAKELEKRYDNRALGSISGVTTGLEEFDGLTYGLQCGRLHIIAARPMMGKSALMGGMAASAAEAGSPCLIYSLEMSTGELVERMIASEGLIDSEKLQSGNLDARDWVALTRAATELSGRLVTFDDEGSLSISDIRSRSRRWRAALPAVCPTPVIFVDYLQLGSGTGNGNGNNREQEVAEVSRGLKALAKELDCAVVALAQLNRNLESRTDKRPMTSDLRESGQIEQDADTIAFVYRDEVYNENTQDKGIAELIVTKNRNGKTGAVKVRWEGRFTKFSNLQQGGNR